MAKIAKIKVRISSALLLSHCLRLTLNKGDTLSATYPKQIKGNIKVIVCNLP